ncbi:hypothetical protein BKA70DRAFT_1405312 [Coprinopsis sp. MPI-PUGE-AT-0042]|nr:hypothetical protein BKA70DRAFT_1405312 [Coprinopsis sp. MPI-PUGE-AT-0042]
MAVLSIEAGTSTLKAGMTSRTGSKANVMTVMHRRHPRGLSSLTFDDDVLHAHGMDGPAESPVVASGWQPSTASAIVGFPKILRTICANIASKKALLSMAVSCKAISSIALDEVWRSRRSMAQLLAPLYCDGFITTLGRDLYLCRVPTGQDPAWARFCEYASRIKVLAAKEDFFGSIHHGTMLRVMQLKGDQPIFPHLRTLTLSGNEDGTVVSDLPLFVSPTLCHVSLQIDSGRRDAYNSAHFVQSFLFRVQEQGVPLEHLSLEAKIPISISSLFSTLSCSKTLPTLHLEGVRCLDADEINWVTELGLLEGLEEFKLVAEEDGSGRVPVQAFRPPHVLNETDAMLIPLATNENSETLPEAHTTPGPPEPKLSPRYSSLKKLYLQGPAKIVDALLSCVASKELGHLTLRPQATTTATTIPELYACFGSLGMQINLHGSLKHFAFESNFEVAPEKSYYYSHDRNPRIPSLRLTAIRKVSQLKYLEVGSPLENTEDFCHSIVAQLPCLVECTIPLSSASAPITVLHTLATSCPDLTRLQLPIRTNFPVFNSTFFAQRKHHLTHLLLSSWDDSYHDQENLLLGVRHLNAAFPYLQALDAGRCWRTVFTMLRILQDIARGE